jgi:membrane-associated phospholipid phosphatase
MFLSDAFWSHIWQVLNKWDQLLFVQINDEWTNKFLDSIYPWYRDSNTWIPLYLFLFLFAVLNFGWRVWPWILFFILTAALTDQVSSTFIKNWVNRTRPCHAEALVNHVRLLLRYCPDSGRFTSSHAANHFGVAVYIFCTMRSYFKKWSYLFFVWAFTICYGQVYVGIHYPLDIVGGAILGSGIGWLTASVFNRRVGLPPLLEKQKSIAI